LPLAGAVRAGGGAFRARAEVDRRERAVATARRRAERRVLRGQPERPANARARRAGAGLGGRARGPRDRALSRAGGPRASGRGARAEMTADRCAALADDPEPLGTASWLAETCARLGAREEAGALYERVAPWRDQFAGTYAIVCRGSLARYLGLLADTAGRYDE